MCYALIDVDIYAFEDSPSIRVWIVSPCSIEKMGLCLIENHFQYRGGEFGGVHASILVDRNPRRFGHWVYD